MSYYDFSNQNQMGMVQPAQWQVPPVQQQRPVAPINDTKFTWIYGGSKSAKAYPQAPNMTGYYRDTQEPYLFEKTTDNYGKVINFKIYKLIEEQEPEAEQVIPQPTGNMVTKDEFDKFTNDINGSIQNLMQSMLDLQNSMNKNYNKPYNQKKGQVNNNVQ